MKIQIRATSPSTSEAAIRDHRVLIDRPVDKGGADGGPMGGELFLASVAGCFMSTLLAAIRAREADVTDVRAEVDAVPEGSPPRFTKIDLNVSGKASDPEMFRKVVDIAEHGCIMVNTLRGKLDLTIRIV